MPYTMTDKARAARANNSRGVHKITDAQRERLRALAAAARKPPRVIVRVDAALATAAKERHGTLDAALKKSLE